MFMSLALLRYRQGDPTSGAALFQSEVAWISNDLESLLYVLLHISTGAKLVWAVYENMQREAYAVKFATMLDEVLFERDVIEKISDPLLRKAAATLRSVFVVNGPDPTICFSEVVCYSTQGVGLGL